VGILWGAAGCEEPGLALHISITNATAIDKVSQVQVTVSGMGLASGARQTVHNIDIAPGDGRVTLTFDKKYFDLKDFQVLLQPTGSSPGMVDVAASMQELDASNKLLVLGSNSQTFDLEKSKRTTGNLALDCIFKTTCDPVEEIDLSSPPTDRAILEIDGSDQDKLIPIATGHFSGVNELNLAVAAPLRTEGGHTKSGVVYIFRGSDFTLPTFQPLQTEDQAIIKIIGRDGDSLGYAAAVGDWDSDSKDDLIVTGIAAGRPSDCGTPGSCKCCPGYQCIKGSTSCTIIGTGGLPSSYAGAGAAYVIQGSRIQKKLGTASPVIDLNDPLELAMTPRIYGATGQENLGKSVAVGHLTSPSILDIVLGAPSGAGPRGMAPRPNAGRVYIASFGPTGGASGEKALFMGDQCDVNMGDESVVLYGPAASSAIGYAGTLAVGDFDGGGRQDLAIGTFTTGLPTTGGSSGGVVYLVRGESTLSGSTIMCAVAPNDLSVEPPDLSGVDLASPADLAGVDLLSVDMAVPPRLPLEVDLATTSDLRLLGAPNSQFGWVVGAAAVEGTQSGKAPSLLVGARNANTLYVISLANKFTGANPQYDVGSLTSGVTLITGSKSVANFASTVAAGNLDGDDFADLLIGAPSATVRNLTNVGAAFAVLGKQIAPNGTLTARVDLDVTAPALTVYGANKDDMLGGHLLVGGFDIHNDTPAPIDEVIVGAENGGGTTAKGAVYVLQNK
jgi:hypothetical protein